MDLDDIVFDYNVLSTLFTIDSPIQPDEVLPQPAKEFPVHPAEVLPQPSEDFPIQPAEIPLQPSEDFPIQPAEIFPKPSEDFPIQPAEIPVQPAEKFPVQPVLSKISKSDSAKIPCPNPAPADVASKKPLKKLVPLKTRKTSKVSRPNVKDSSEQISKPSSQVSSIGFSPVIQKLMRKKTRTRSNLKDPRICFERFKNKPRLHLPVTPSLIEMTKRITEERRALKESNKPAKVRLDSNKYPPDVVSEKSTQKGYKIPKVSRPSVEDSTSKVSKIPSPKDPKPSAVDDKSFPSKRRQFDRKSGEPMQMQEKIPSSPTKKMIYYNQKTVAVLSISAKGFTLCNGVETFAEHGCVNTMSIMKEIVRRKIRMLNCLDEKTFKVWRKVKASYTHLFKNIQDVCMKPFHISACKFCNSNDCDKWKAAAGMSYLYKFPFDPFYH